VLNIWIIVTLYLEDSERNNFDNQLFFKDKILL
jgi:hypothetical protein